MGASRILIIDDDADLAETTAEYLRLDGHEVDVAFDARTGMDAAARRRYDHILVDLGLPDMGGIEVLNRIRESSPDVHMLLVTGHSAASLDVELGGAGEVEVLTKPVPPELLSQRMA